MTTVVAVTRNSLQSRLKWAREAADLSASALSELAGLTRSHVSLIEKGGRRRETVDARTLSALADVLGISMDWLFAGKGDRPAREAICQAVEECRRRSGTPTAVSRTG